LVQVWSTIVAAGDDLAELARCQAEPALGAAFIPHPRPGGYGLRTGGVLSAADEIQSIRDGIQMSIAALFTWIITIMGGLILLVIWIIEYDREFQSAAATRLPVPVISAHALLAMGGLLFWIAYLLLAEERLAWAAVAILGTVAVLGLIMAARWIRVYRSFAAPGPSLTRSTNAPPDGRSFCGEACPHW
jgi:manganese efflux pump family protein